jgi:biotin synthase-related radical SAM superfamily protein
MDFIRVSAGSAAVLGLRPLKMLHQPTTIHLLQHAPDGCNANCSFCPQARDSLVDKGKLSRVTWPAFPWRDVKEKVVICHAKGHCVRVCLQTVVYPAFIPDLLQAVQELLSTRAMPVSVALVPVAKSIMAELKAAGVDRVGIALDTATPELFSNIKGAGAGGPYTWDGHWRALQDALDVFGKNHVSTHLIAGLGENEHEIVDRMQQVHDAGITIGLFAFTAIPGTRLASQEPPALNQYRRIQLARYLIINGLSRSTRFTFDASTGAIIGWGLADPSVIELIREKHGRMFETSGCPGCNRPYYNESTRGPMYNHPVALDTKQIQGAIDLLFPGT